MPETCRPSAWFCCSAASAVGLFALSAVGQTKEDLIRHGADRYREPAGEPVCSGDATRLMFPLDDSYTLVDFCGDGPTGVGPAECGEGAGAQNNDDDSATVALPFAFDLYNDPYTTVFVNNNGNLSFATPFSTFTASGFPSLDFRMVAPFWGDVDTGNQSTVQVGDVWMKFFGENTLVVTWDNVGYFRQHGDLRNTFQVAISDGTNPVMGLGNNVCFSWDDMCWTTGDASGGSGGFGGVPATVGANRGDGVEFFQIGRFDQPGTAFDGPFGMSDGVDYLDFRSTCFSTAVITNVAPIPQGFPPGNQIAIDAGFGDVLDLTLQFLSPEAGQTVTATVDDRNGAQAAGLLIADDSPNLEIVTVDLDWAPDCADAGSYTLDFTAVDDFIPPGETNVSLELNVLCTITGCCRPAPSCLDLTPFNCTGQGGDPLDPGLLCSGNDCNGNGADDACDIAGCAGEPGCADCNANGVPDECDIADCDEDPACKDCNGNGIPDECDLTAMTSQDCNTNGSPDECEIDEDSPASGGPFFCTTACDPDCNFNGAPDECDIAEGTSLDEDEDGRPDECITTVEPGVNWSDDIWGLTGPNPFPDDLVGVPNLHVNLEASADVLLDLTVMIPSLTLSNSAAVRITQTGAVGNLIFDPPAVLFAEGAILVAADRVIGLTEAHGAGRPLPAVALGGGAVYRKDPASVEPTSATLNAASVTLLPTFCGATDQMTLSDHMTVRITGDFVMDGSGLGLCALAPGCFGPCIPPVRHARRVLGGRTPEILKLKDVALLASEGGFSMIGGANVCVGCESEPRMERASPGREENAVSPNATQVPSPPERGPPPFEGPTVELGGDFDNRSLLPSLFDWVGGRLILNGTTPQTFEVGGIDLGPTFEGFSTGADTIADTEPHTNFAMGRIEVGPGVDVTFGNTFANTVGSNPCDEALYVHDLILRSGASVTFDACKVYYVNLVEETGVVRTTSGCGALLSACALDPPLHQPEGMPKNRYLTFIGNNPGRSTAIRVTFVDLPAPFDVLNGQTLWAGQPQAVSEIADRSDATPPTFQAAPLECEPFFTDWSTRGPVQLFHGGIVPNGLYRLQAIDSRCPTSLEASFSDSLELATTSWGDVAGPFDSLRGRWTDPDDRVDVTTDLVAMIDKFANRPTAPPKAQVDLHPEVPDHVVDSLDLMRGVDAFRGVSYPFAPPPPCIR